MDGNEENVPFVERHRQDKIKCTNIGNREIGKIKGEKIVSTKLSG